MPGTVVHRQVWRAIPAVFLQLPRSERTETLAALPRLSASDRKQGMIVTADIVGIYRNARLCLERAVQQAQCEPV